MGDDRLNLRKINPFVHADYLGHGVARQHRLTVRAEPGAVIVDVIGHFA